MNKRLKIAIVLIAIVLIAALAISIAYSKYFTEVSGTGTTTVAYWNFTVNGASDTIATITLGNTTDDNDKVAEDVIAPGTSGSFAIEIDATGTQVALDYEISLENFDGDLPDNLKFYIDDTYTTELAYDSTNLNYSIDGSFDVDDEKTATETIYWVWEYETGTDDTTISANDEVDTDDGENAANITFDIVVTGTQQD